VARLLSTAATFAFAAFVWTACSAPPPNRPLVSGYYTLDGGNAGFVRRLIVTQGTRRLSYDVWLVSTKDDGSSRHAHYDLIARDDVPDSGEFAVTQDGTDCGTMWVGPYRDSDGIHDEILVLSYDGKWQPVGAGALQNRPTPEQYAELDRENMQHIAMLAAERPNLYATMNYRDRESYSALLPECDD
jgi:hypothetical protein